MRKRKQLLYVAYGKRTLGVLIAVIGLLIVWPLILLIALGIKLDSRGQVIFKQKRLGRNKKIFTIYKFRTMVPDAYKIGGTKSYKEDPRITRIGSYLRRTSLDELPQLINILKGEMSIIGPRPILEEEFREYEKNEIYEKRFLVNPGLFCTVDLTYRASASRQIQFTMDAEYADKVSLSLDIKTFLKIIEKIIKQENIYPTSL